MKAASKRGARSVSRLSPQEEKDVEKSLKELKDGKARTVHNVKELVEELESD